MVFYNANTGVIVFLFNYKLYSQTYAATAQPRSDISTEIGIVVGFVGLVVLVTSLVIVVLSIAFIRGKSARFNVTPLTRDLSATNESKNTLNINIHGNDAYTCTSPIQTRTNESYVKRSPLFPNQAYASVNMGEQMYASIDETENNQAYTSIATEKEMLDVGEAPFNISHISHTPVAGIFQ